MSNLAERVRQRMQQKKQQQQRRRPPFPLLRLWVQFELQAHQRLKGSITELQKQITCYQGSQDTLQHCQQTLDATGKKGTPKLIILPEFIAAPSIPAAVKEYVFKAANSFSTQSTTNTLAQHLSLEQEQLYCAVVIKVKSTQESSQRRRNQYYEALNERRNEVMKEKLRLERIIAEQKEIEREMERMYQKNKYMVVQYEIKRNNLQERRNHLKCTGDKGKMYRKIIQEKYNPEKYREYVGNIMLKRSNNEQIKIQIKQIAKSIFSVNRSCGRKEEKLAKSKSLILIGKVKDWEKDKNIGQDKKINQSNFNVIQTPKKQNGQKNNLMSTRESFKTMGSSAQLQKKSFI